jgi:hypothetical protein
MTYDFNHFPGGIMRTTLDVEEDVLLAAKEIARQQRLSIGKVLSNLCRQALTRQRTGSTRNGAPLFPIQKKAGAATLELINRLRDERS